MEKTFLRNVSSGRILLTVFALFVISLFVIRFLENQQLLKTRIGISELTEKSVRRQGLLIKMRKGSDYAHVNLLRYLFYRNKRKKELAENTIYAESVKNYVNFNEFEKSIIDSKEHLIFDTLVNLRKEYKKNRLQLIHLIKAGEENKSALFNERYLIDSYEKFQRTNTILSGYCSQRDSKAVEQVQAMFFSQKKTRAEINYGLLLGLTVLGLMIARTVAKLRKSNLLLAESEWKYRTVLERTTEIIKTANHEGKLVEVNNAFTEKLGYKENEIPTLTILDILAPESKSQYYPYPSKNQYGEVITGIRKTLLSKSGAEIIVEGNVILHYKDETFESSTAFFNDVTEKVIAEKALVASETKYRQLFELGPVPILVINPKDLRFIQANNAASVLYGFKEREFGSMVFSDLFMGVERSKLDKIINNERRKGFKYIGTYRQITKSGEEIIVNIHSSDILLNDVPKKIIVALDVTEKSKHEQMLNRAIVKTQEDERYQIGIELHDNVCQILAAAQITMGLIEKSIPTAIHGLFEKVVGHIELATQEIRNLSHQLAPAFFDETNLHEAIKGLLRSINIDNKYKIALDIERRIITNPINQEIKLNLFRILQEQLRNILKHANATQINVQINIDQDKLFMQITDNGIGFNMEEVSRGIGFANMLRRTTMFDGNLEVLSSPGHGCKVVIAIPYN
ncbi:MAG: PAS domain S-box protein [Bacteroidetes bacterium]|nr:PAS domain S-box protein [Bacteroidota bacterium]